LKGVKMQDNLSNYGIEEEKLTSKKLKNKKVHKPWKLECRTTKVPDWAKWMMSADRKWRVQSSYVTERAVKDAYRMALHKFHFDSFKHEWRIRFKK
jgi:hypothetical protein